MRRLFQGRRWVLATGALVASAVVLAACDSEQTTVKDALLSDGDIGSLAGGFREVETPQEYFEDNSACRVDPPEQFPGMGEKTTTTYQRQVDGGTETLLVGAWKQDYDSFDNAASEMTQREGINDDCETAYSEDDRDFIAWDNMPFSINVVTSVTEYWKGTSEESGIEAVSKKYYTWGDGYVITVWSTSTGKRPPDSMATNRIFNLQVKHVVDELDLDRSNFAP